jgi:hypothetical protein
MENTRAFVTENGREFHLHGSAQVFIPEMIVFEFLGEAMIDL